MNNLVAGGQTAIGDAVRRGLNAIVAGGRAASQVMVLFTDGLQNAGTETAEQVLPDLRANGVRVYTISLGGDQGSTLLEAVATTTGASYFPISGALPAAQAEAAVTAVTAALVQIAGDSRENGGVVAFDGIDGAGNPIDDDAPFFGPVGESFGETGERSLRFKVTISEGSTHATLGAMWRADKKGIRVRIYDPNGSPVPAGPQVRAVRGRNPYAFFDDAPMPGTWQVEVIGSLLGGAGLRSIGFEVNNAVRLEASAVPHHPVRGETFRLRARLLSPHPVPDADISARIYSPAGAWSRVQLTPGAVGTAEQGLYTADVATEERFPGQYLIVVDAFRKAGTFSEQLDELYTLRTGFTAGDETRTVTTPEIRRQAILSVVTSKEEPNPDEPKPGANEVDPVVPKSQDRFLACWLRSHPQSQTPEPRQPSRPGRQRN